MREDFDKALLKLRTDDIVAIPTETVYGLAGSIASPKAIDKIFKVKERPFFDPLIVHIADFEQIYFVADQVPDIVKKLAKKYWPGPLTIILPKKTTLNEKITSGLLTVGVRIPDHDLTRNLIRELGIPLAAPSANKFKKTSPTCAEHVQAEFGETVHILDGGPSRVGVESTVIGFNHDFSAIKIFRPGAVTKVDLEAFAPTAYAAHPLDTFSANANKNTVEATNADERLHSPGMLRHHYMPNIPLVILSTTDHLTCDNYEQIRTQLSYSALYPSWMTLSDDPTIAARELYSELRKASELNQANCVLLRYNLIPYIQYLNNKLSIKNVDSLGKQFAIFDRLYKAASLVI